MASNYKSDESDEENVLGEFLKPENEENNDEKEANYQRLKERAELKKSFANREKTRTD